MLSFKYFALHCTILASYYYLLYNWWKIGGTWRCGHSTIAPQWRRQGDETGMPGARFLGGGGLGAWGLGHSLRSRRYSRAQGGKLEIPPAQKLSNLSSGDGAF